MAQHDGPFRRIALTRRQVAGGAAGLAAFAGLGVRPQLTRAQEVVSGDVTYWHHFTSESEMAGLEEVIASFEEANADAAIIAENIPNADYMTQFTTAAVSGSLPNTAMATVDRIPDMLALGGLVDLTARFDAWDGKSAIPENLMVGGTVDGMVYGVPMFLFVDWLYYRADWFEEAGIDPPNTWDEMREAAIALTDPAQNRYGFGLRGGDGGQGAVMGIMRAYGGLSADENGVPVIDREKAIEAVAFWAGLFTTDKVAPPSAPNDSYSQIMQAFRTGQTAMILHHTGSLAEITADLEPGTEVMTTLVPEGPAMRVAGVAPLYNSMTNAGNEDASWAWLTHWTNPDVAIGFLETTGYFPATTAAAEDPRITDNPIYAAAVETMSIGVPPLSFIGAPGWGGTSVLPAFQQVLTGQATPEEAVDQMIAGLAEATE